MSCRFIGASKGWETWCETHRMRAISCLQWAQDDGPWQALRRFQNEQENKKAIEALVKAVKP